jgi:hypothetical protein
MNFVEIASTLTKLIEILLKLRDGPQAKIQVDDNDFDIPEELWADFYVALKQSDLIGALHKAALYYYNKKQIEDIDLEKI